MRINRDKVNDGSRKVRHGDVLTIRVGRGVVVVKVVGFAAARVSPPDVVNLYERIDEGG